jgi:hypothetical protein
MQEDLRYKIGLTRMKCSALDQVEINSFDGVDGGYLEAEPDSQHLIEKY